MIWTLRNGKNVKFWYDNWMEYFPLIDKIHPNMCQHIEENAKVSDLSYQYSSHSYYT